MHVVTRDIDAGDLEIVQAMVREYYQESPFFCRIFPVPSEVADAFFKALSNHRIYVQLAHYRDEIAGIFWGGLGSFFGTKCLFAYDVFCFIRPKFRGRDIARTFLNEFEMWALKNGCYCVRFVAFSSADNTGVAHFLERAGYQRSGTNLVKIL